MTIRTRIRPKIAHFGAFDHDSYGDLIFPFIVEHYLPEFEFVHVSPSGKPTPWSDAKETISVREAFEIKDWDGILVGGGDIIQAAEGFIWNDSALQSLGALLSLWSGASLLSAKLGIPCAWNSPGVPAELPDPTLSMAQDSIQCVDYLSVRDELSAGRIKRLVNHPLNIVPDTALVISEIWKSGGINDGNKPLILSITPSDIDQRFEQIEFLIRNSTKDNGFSGEVVILPLMEWQGSLLLQKIEKLKSEFNITIKDRSLTLQECALEISKGRAYVGNSLHGLITALSYGIPAVHVKPVGFASVTKYQGFAKHFPDGEQLLAENFIDASRIISSCHTTKINKSIKLIKEHFSQIKKALNNNSYSKNNKWESIIQACDTEARNLLMHGYSAYQLLNDRSKKQNIRDSQIGNLNQAVTERDGQIDSLNQAVTERDSQIVSLNRAVTERDSQIGNLNQAVTERDSQIDSLNRAVTERDGQIDSLNQAVTERDSQIDSLNRAVTERDSQIDSLNRAVTERDSLTLFQGQRIQSLLQSRSWRWTTPLRLVTSYLRLGTRPFQVALNRISARLPIIREISIRRIRQNLLFDQTFYALNNPDVCAAGIDPATHYFLLGWKEHRDPSEHFCTRLYLQNHPDVAAAGINPLLHYINNGQNEGRKISRLANDLQHQLKNANEYSPTKIVVSVAPDQERVIDKCAGQSEQTPLYDNNLSSAPDLVDAEVEAISKSGLFDAVYYLAMYPDIQPQPADPIRHYCEHGWHEGRNPSDNFDTRGYLDAYSDIKNANLNPFWHYVVAGITESRQATPDSSSRFEDDVYFGNLSSDIQLVAYYATPDWESVQRARKPAKGAGQGIMPHEDLGQYGTAQYELLRKQALMAKRHGVCGWCFSFDTAHVPDASDPISEFLANCDIDIRFCLDINLSSSKIDQRTLAFLETALSDERCLRIDDHPVLVMTLPDDDSDCIAVLRAFDVLFTGRQTLRPYRIVRRNKLAGQALNAAAQFMCEAVLDLPVDPVPAETGSFKPLVKNGVHTVPYSVVVSQSIARICAAKTLPVPTYRVISLGRDDAPINPKRPLRYTRFHMREYRRWLESAIADTRATHGQDRRLLFLNAWNGWNHGAMLEPDRVSGYSKLNETSRALLGLPSGLALPKVSVIVPNYNHAQYLNRRLESIYRQTYRNIEVLLLDDCSTDQSRTVLAEYAERHPEITTLLFNEQNSGGVFRQWAKGIKAASGDLIWIAESDDYCDENFLEKLVRCFDDEAVMLAYSRVEFVRADESVMPEEFWQHVRDLECREKWKHSYVNTAHQEVSEALGIINTIPNASGAIFRRPVAMPLLEDEAWLSMGVVGDWVFYLHQLRGGKIAYSVETTNYFRRHDSSTAASTYKKELFYKELGIAARAVQGLYDVPNSVLNQCRKKCKWYYAIHGGTDDAEFSAWFNEELIWQSRQRRTPNILITTQGFYPGGAEILPIRMANEFKRQGHSVLLLSGGHGQPESGVRQMLRRDVPVVETPNIEKMANIIHDFGIEVLNSHQWHVQKYPTQVPNVFCELKAHVASLHGMIEHGDAFGVTSDQLAIASENVTTWVYTADKNLGPFIEHGLYEEDSLRFIKLPNGMAPPTIKAVPRSEIGMPDDAFVLCCVSRAIPDKGWAETIEAVTRAREISGRDIRLILVGNGPVYDEYCHIGVPDFVYLAGFAENSVGYYAAADMGVMLTKFRSESFPLTIVDCLFAGKPYISCDVGEIQSMLSEGDEVAGAVVPLNDWEVPVKQVAEIIAAFSTDTRQYSDALAVVPKLVERYRIDNVVKRYVDIFQATLTARASTALDQVN